MDKKLAININGQINNSLNKLVEKETVIDLDVAYKLMAEDQEREREALAWAENLIGHIDELPFHPL